ARRGRRPARRGGDRLRLRRGGPARHRTARGARLEPAALLRPRTAGRPRAVRRGRRGGGGETDEGAASVAGAVPAGRGRGGRVRRQPLAPPGRGVPPGVPGGRRPPHPARPARRADPLPHPRGAPSCRRTRRGRPAHVSRGGTGGRPCPPVTTRPGGRIAPPGAGPAVRGVSEGGKLVPAPRPVRSPPASVTARPSLSTTHGAPDARAPGSPDRTDRRGTARPGRPLAGRQLPGGGPDLPAREPAAHRAPAAGAHQAAPARPLGHLTGTEPGVHA